MTTIELKSPPHAFARSDRSALGQWWWTVDHWLLGAAGLLITVGVMVSGAASSGSDYDLGTGDQSLTFQPGETMKMVRVTVRGDSSNEPDEDVVLTLQTAVNATNAAEGSSIACMSS